MRENRETGQTKDMLAVGPSDLEYIGRYACTM